MQWPDLPFLKALPSDRVFLMDGAMGTELQRVGAQQGECFELWNLTHPHRVQAVHQAYLHAGADCLVTNTFQALPETLAKHGLRKHLPDIAAAGVQLARAVAGPNQFVLASLGPMSQDDASQAEEVIASLAGADALLLETWSDTKLLQKVLPTITASSLPHPLPVLVSITFVSTAQAGPHTIHGATPEEVARQVEQLGVDALGVNCGRNIGMAETLEIIRRYRTATKLPLFARPNAGTPMREGNRWLYPGTPERMAAGMPELLKAGASMIGGCCGTTPQHIAAFRQVIERWNAQRNLPDPQGKPV